MTRYSMALVILCVSAAGCRGSAPEATVAQEPPPPLIEPELAPGSRLVEARAEELVRQMSERLASATAFALEAEEVYDEVPEHSPRRQLTNLRHVAMRRPDRLVGDATGDALNRSFWYDGKTFAALNKEQNVWAGGTVPPTVDGALDWVFEQTGTVVPLADFLYADSYARLMENVQRGVYLGIHEAAGVPCHHLSFEQATIDWQLWIDAGSEPLPRKLVITYKTEDEVPQYAVTIRKWNLKATLPDRLFRVHAAGWRHARGSGGVWRGAGCAYGRTAMTKNLTALIAAAALVAGAGRAAVCPAGGPRVGVGCIAHHADQVGQHHDHPGSAAPPAPERSPRRATATTSTSRSRPRAAPPRA